MIIKDLKNKFLQKYLSFAGFFHFLVDFLPISTLYLYSKNLYEFGTLIIIYNLIAFGLQPLLGLFVDKFHKYNFYLSITSVFLSLIGAILSLSPWISIVLLGLGNALFHVSFAKEVLRNAKSNFPLGFFISFGVLGLGIGFSFYSEILITSFIFIGFVNLILFFLIFKNEDFVNKNEQNAIGINKKTIVPLLILVITSISLRALLGKVTPSIDIPLSYLIICIFAFFGKFIGGLFNRKISIISSFIITIFSAFFIQYNFGIILFTFSINLLMPTTLDYLRKIFKNYEALSLGVSAFFLLVPIYVLGIFETFDCSAVFIVSISIHLFVLILIFIVEITGIKKEA